MNRFQVKSQFADDFETRWRDRESFLSEFDGFMRFWLLRSEDTEGTTEFVSHSQWLTRENFLVWVDSDRSKKAHAAGAEKVPAMRDMIAGPPQFKGYVRVLDQVTGGRVDARSTFLDLKVEKSFAQVDVAQKQILSDSKAEGLPTISLGAFEGRLIEVLLRSAQCRRGVEIGTLGGYSTSWLCRAVGPEGKVYTCELKDERADLARRNLAHAGFAKTSEVLAGDALKSLEGLVKEGPFDFVFIDADKANYPNYCRWALANLKVGGLLLCDNAYLWGGMDHWGTSAENLPQLKGDRHTKTQFKAMSECWDFLAQTPELASIVLPTGDGLALAVKR